MRRTLVVGLIGLALPGVASAQTLSLRVDPGSVPYNRSVAFTGVLSPGQARAPIGIYLRSGAQGILVASGSTAVDGSYAIQAIAREPGTFFAIAQTNTGGVRSPDVGLRVRPSLAVRLTGKRAVGERLRLSGRLLPARAGRLTLAFGGETLRVRLGSSGHFNLALPDQMPGRLRWSVSLAPAAGYETVRVRRSTTIRAPRLGMQSAGTAVRALERRLHELNYALKRVNGYYGYDTFQAVLAFQKVHGMARTGRVDGPVWQRLASARVPTAFVPRGNHIEVSKTKQVLYEVRGGKVVNVIHVSTGATGNTPVGRWRVYRLGPGGSLSHMYYSMYFLRGFAIHGYHSVPSWPASHGCVRIPLWQARGLYSRWGRVGTQIYVFP